MILIALAIASHTATAVVAIIVTRRWTIRTIERRIGTGAR